MSACVNLRRLIEVCVCLHVGNLPGDQQIALQSKIHTHQPQTTTAMREQVVATAILRNLLELPRAAPTFVWSHEAFIMLRESYAEHYLDFLFADRATLPSKEQNTARINARV